MQLNGGMGNIKKKSRRKKKKKKRENYAKNLLVERSDFPSLFNRIEYNIASLTTGILCIQGVNARRNKVEILPSSIMSAVFSCLGANYIRIFWFSKTLLLKSYHEYHKVIWLHQCYLRGIQCGENPSSQSSFLRRDFSLAACVQSGVLSPDVSNFIYASALNKAFPVTSSVRT